jgi:NACHT domain
VKSENGTTRQLIGQEHAGTRAHVETKLNDLHHTFNTEDQRLRFLKSLRYQEMNARRNQGPESFPDTYNWVFDETTSKTWPSFSNWLKQGSGVYWIQGKAGSGKSTLMKFIIKDKRTREALEAGSTLKDPVLLSFFFWLSGEPLERNLHGLLSSLLHQLLEDNAPLTMQLLQKDLSLQRKVYVQDWDVQELSSLLRTVVRQQAESRPLCIFLDGLDEYERKADFRQPMDLIRDLSQEKNVKVCVSSRPEQHIRHELGGIGFLRLQDLTKADIHKFVSSELEDACHPRHPSVDVPAQEKLVEMIVEKADGVFLWVRVALRDILRGITKHDTFDELKRRVDRLPADIELLYENMLQRLGEDWELCRQEAALYFKICLLMNEFEFCLPNIDLSLLLYSAVSGRKSLQDLTRTPTSIVDLHELLGQLKRTEARITACCAGMLEINEADTEEDFNEQENIDDEAASDDKEVDVPFRQDTSDILQRVRLYSRRTVTISHRTVLDFLLEKPAGREVLECCPENESAILYDILDAVLMAYRARIQPGPIFQDLSSLVWCVADGCSLKPAVTELALYELLQRIERTFRMICTSPDKSTDEEGTQWVYDLISGAGWAAIDFMGLTLELGLPEYFEHDLGRMLKKELHTGKTLSANYKNYLLLCASSGVKKGSVRVLKSLLEAGADPNAIFYLPFHFRPKTSPWIVLLGSLETGDLEECDRVIGNFLASGADLRELAVKSSIFTSSYCWEFVDISSKVSPNGNDVLIERNARYMLQDCLDRHGNHESLHLQHPSYIGVPSHRRVLLVRPNDKNQFAKVTSAEESASLLATMEEEMKAIPTSFARTIDKIQECYDRSEKVDDRLKLLEQLGYYKDPEDPAVLRGPIERFEDLPDEPDAA